MSVPLVGSFEAESEVEGTAYELIFESVAGAGKVNFEAQVEIFGSTVTDGSFEVRVGGCVDVAFTTGSR